MRFAAPLAAVPLLLGAACAHAPRAGAGATAGASDVRIVHVDDQTVRLALARPGYVTLFAPNRDGPPGVVAVAADEAGSQPHAAGTVDIELPRVSRQRWVPALVQRGPVALFAVVSSRPLAEEAAAFQASYRAAPGVRASFPVVGLSNARTEFVAAVARDSTRVATDLYAADRDAGRTGRTVRPYAPGGTTVGGCAARAATDTDGSAPAGVQKCDDASGVH